MSERNTNKYLAAILLGSSLLISGSVEFKRIEKENIVFREYLAKEKQVSAYTISLARDQAEKSNGPRSWNDFLKNIVATGMAIGGCYFARQTDNREEN